MTRWLSDYQINLKAGVPQSSVLSPLLFLIYVNDLPTPHHKQNSLSQFVDDTAQWAFSLNIRIVAKLLQQDLLKLAMWCAKWRIKLNPTKTKKIIFSRSILARKTELNLKLYGETLKIYPQVKFLGITFDSQLNFKKYFEEILDRCNTRYHRLRLLVSKKWGLSPATIIQIYKQCVYPIFESGSLSTITASDYIITKIQQLQNKFIRLALRLPKYICSKLLHDSTGLPYVKDRLLSCATKSLDRIAQNPLVGESISSNRLNPAWDRFLTPLFVVRPVSPKDKVNCWGDLPKACHYLKQAIRPIRGHVLAQSTDYEIKTTIDCPGNLTSEIHIVSLSDTVSGSSLHHFAHIVRSNLFSPTYWQY